MRVTIIGSGAWGTTLAGLAHHAGSDVTLVARNAAVHRSLSSARQHPASLPGYKLPEAVSVVRDAVDALRAAPDCLLVAVPSASVSSVAEVIASSGYPGPIVTATKGLDPEQLTTPSERIVEAIGTRVRVAALSGPNLAGEIAMGLPAAAVLAATDETVAHVARAALMSARFRIYTSDDVIGVEIAGAFKNIIAIGAGIADGLDAGENAKAAYMTRGIAEMARLGIACGANPLTFAGLAGVGDLIATCNSERSRNHTVGRGLADGRELQEILRSLREVAEGVPTTRAALALGEVKGVQLPIATQIARVMFDGVPPEDAIAELMARDATRELNFLQ